MLVVTGACFTITKVLPISVYFLAYITEFIYSSGRTVVSSLSPCVRPILDFNSQIAPFKPFSVLLLNYRVMAKTGGQ